MKIAWVIKWTSMPENCMVADTSVQFQTRSNFHTGTELETNEHDNHEEGKKSSRLHATSWWIDHAYLHTSDSMPLARSEKGTTQKTYIARSRFTHTMI